MKYSEAIQYITEAQKYGSKLGLDTMRALMEQLGNPQDELKFVHIAGTNGKGSVLAYISTVLTTAGYRTGSYTSPAIADLREHFLIDGEIISKKQYADCVARLQQAVLKLKETGLTPTMFELETALAFLHFKKMECDIVVLETGLGGLLDATNIIKTTVLSVITSISMDHADILGTTLEEIAVQKAGIIKPQVPVVFMENDDSVTHVIVEKCQQSGSEFFIAASRKLYQVTYGFAAQKFSYGQFAHAQIRLAGTYQVMNAALAIEAFWSLRNSGYAVWAAEIRAGLLKTKWPYRLEQIKEAPQFILDGGHNPEAAFRLRESLSLYFPGRPLIFIMGVFKDKDYKQICKITADMAKYIITVQTPGSKRALAASKLRAAVLPYNQNAEAADSLQEAVEMSYAAAKRYDNPLIIAFGSLAYLAELKQLVLKYDLHRSDDAHGQE